MRNSSSPTGEPGRSRRIAGSEGLDYALVEVALPPGPTLPTIRLATKDAAPSDRVYSVSAHADLHHIQGQTEDLRALFTFQQRDLSDAMKIEHEPASGLRTIALGKRVATPSALRDETDHFFNMPNAPGRSGSPVVSQRTHEVVAINNGMRERERLSTATPITLVLSDLKRRLASGQIDDSDGSVAALLRTQDR
jgi:hypothetical protein